MDAPAFYTMLAEKLLSSLQLNGIGMAILGPSIYYRMGKNKQKLKRHAALLDEKTRKNIEDLRNGSLTFTDDLDDEDCSLLPKELKVDGLNITNLRQKLEESAVKKLFVKELNISSAVMYAYEMLYKDMSAPTETPVRTDWINQWAEYASLISEEKLQILWGKVLAGEIKSPGKYSLRTLLLLKNINQKDAEKISRLSSFFLGQFIFRNPDNIEKNIPFDVLLELQELGIIQGVEAMSLVENIDSQYGDRFEESIILDGRILTITSVGPNRRLRLTLPIYRVTSLGKEIFSLIDSKTDEKYILEVCEYIKSQGFEVIL